MDSHDRSGDRSRDRTLFLALRITYGQPKPVPGPVLQSRFGPDRSKDQTWIKSPLKPLQTPVSSAVGSNRTLSWCHLNPPPDTCFLQCRCFRTGTRVSGPDRVQSPGPCLRPGKGTDGLVSRTTPGPTRRDLGANRPVRQLTDCHLSDFSVNPCNNIKKNPGSILQKSPIRRFKPRGQPGQGAKSRSLPATGPGQLSKGSFGRASFRTTPGEATAPGPTRSDLGASRPKR